MSDESATPPEIGATAPEVGFALPLPQRNIDDFAEPGDFQPMPADITKAVIQVMKKVGTIGKTGQNKFHGYSYASIEDLMPPLQKAMAEAGLVITQHPVKIGMDDGGNMTVHYRFMLHHESGNSYLYPGHWLGVAGDRDRSGRLGDKWANKCHTAAEKYFMIKLFRIPVSDGTPQPLSDGDPDAGDGNHMPAMQGCQQGPQPVPSNPAAAAHPASADMRALANRIKDEIDASSNPMQILIDRHQELSEIRAVSEAAAATLERRAAKRHEELKQEKAA